MEGIRGFRSLALVGIRFAAYHTLRLAVVAGTVRDLAHKAQARKSIQPSLAVHSGGHHPFGSDFGNPHSFLYCC